MVTHAEIARMLQDAEAGATNLTCPRCEISVDFLDIQRNGLWDIHPDRLFPCPHCPAVFWPENGFLYQLHQELGETAYFGIALPLGGVTSGNFTDVRVGHSKEHGQHSMEQGFHIETITLLSAKLAEGDADLTPTALNGSFTRASLGESVILTLVPTDSVSVAINATLREAAEEGKPVSTGDQIDLQYRYVKAPTAGTNPPWIDLLREAERAIRRDNKFAAYPLLVSAMDDFLARQVILYFRWQGRALAEAIDRLDSYGGRNGPNRYQIVEDVFSDMVDRTLPGSRYGEEWDWFKEMNRTRNGIVHPDAEPMEQPTRSEAIDSFNQTMDLMSKIFDFVWFDGVDGNSS